VDRDGPNLNWTRLPEERRSFGSRESSRINDLERPHADNQAFINGFSREIKCGLREDLADCCGAITEP
jgi:hypothetical protein